MMFLFPYFESSYNSVFILKIFLWFLSPVKIKGLQPLRKSIKLCLTFQFIWVKLGWFLFSTLAIYFFTFLPSSMQPLTLLFFSLALDSVYSPKPWSLVKLISACLLTFSSYPFLSLLGLLTYSPHGLTFHPETRKVSLCIKNVNKWASCIIHPT